MVLLGLLAAMMLVASPVLAWQPGPNEGSKCYKYYTEYHKKWNNGKKYYYVHVYYKWRTPDSIRHTQDYWYYSQYHKYDDPDSTHPYFKAWVTYKPTGNHYWESFYWQCPKC